MVSMHKAKSPWTGCVHGPTPSSHKAPQALCAYAGLRGILSQPNPNMLGEGESRVKQWSGEGFGIMWAGV